MKYLDQLKKAIQDGRFRQMYHNRLRPTFWVYTPEIHFLQSNLVLYKRLKRSYRQVPATATPYSETQKIHFNKIPIFICWFQGFDQAPDIVKGCIHSIDNTFPHDKYEVVEITTENFSKYVDFPAYIMEKWEKGIISNTHFSDLLRLELLIRYGGYWIDATVYNGSREIPSYLDNTDFFVYSNDLRGDTTMVAESWLIKAPVNQPILVLTRKYLYAYWQKKNYLCHYFLFHLFFSMSCEVYPEIYGNVPQVSSVDPHMMVKYLEKSYDQDTMTYLNEISYFHKLTYKLDFSTMATDSLYDALLKKEQVGNESN